MLVLESYAVTTVTTFLLRELSFPLMVGEAENKAAHYRTPPQASQWLPKWCNLWDFENFPVSKDIFLSLALMIDILTLTISAFG